MVDIKSEHQFDELMGKEDGLVIVDFWASWCGPCMALKPVIEKICKERKITLFKVNVDENKPLAQRYQISSIPVLLVFKWGEMRTGSMGNLSESDLNKLIDNELNPPIEKPKSEIDI